MLGGEICRLLAERGPLRGDRPRVVARVGLLLVRGVVLLVDADQAEVRDGGEDGRPRPHHDRGVTGADPLALVPPLGLRQRRVEDGDAVAEPRLEPSDGLRGERDLRDEHNHAAPGL